MDIGDKRVLITGGSSGIGFALAWSMGKRGARIAITGRRKDAPVSAKEQLRAGGIDVKIIVADAATDAGRAATLEAAVGALGGLDVLVDNAGGVRAGRLEDLEPALAEAVRDHTAL